MDSRLVWVALSLIPRAPWARLLLHWAYPIRGCAVIKQFEVFASNSRPRWNGKRPSCLLRWRWRDRRYKQPTPAPVRLLFSFTHVKGERKSVLRGYGGWREANIWWVPGKERNAVGITRKGVLCVGALKEMLTKSGAWCMLPQSAETVEEMLRKRRY